MSRCLYKGEDLVNRSVTGQPSRRDKVWRRGREAHYTCQSGCNCRCVPCCMSAFPALNYVEIGRFSIVHYIGFIDHTRNSSWVSSSCRSERHVVGFDILNVQMPLYLVSPQHELTAKAVQAQAGSLGWRMEPQYVCVHRFPMSTAEASEGVPSMHQQLREDTWALLSWKHFPRLKKMNTVGKNLSLKARSHSCN